MKTFEHNRTKYEIERSPGGIWNLYRKDGHRRMWLASSEYQNDLICAVEQGRLK